MTEPIPHGYPDWQPQTPSSDTIYAIDLANVITAPITYGRFFVGNMRTIGVWLTATVDHYHLDLVWYDQATGGTVMGRVQASVRQGSIFSQSIPNRGSWFELTITPHDATDHTYDLRISGHQQQHVNLETLGDNVLLSWSAAAGAGATITTDSARVWPGPASLHYRVTASAWTIQLEALDYVGAVTMIFQNDNANPGPNSVIMLPATNIRATFTNVDGVSRNIRLALLADPRYIS